MIKPNDTADCIVTRGRISIDEKYVGNSKKNFVRERDQTGCLRLYLDLEMDDINYALDWLTCDSNVVSITYEHGIKSLRGLNFSARGKIQTVSCDFSASDTWLSVHMRIEILKTEGVYNLNFERVNG